MRGLSLLLLVLPSLAHSFCLNPFGCEPETRSECLQRAGEARTESAAKALIAECLKLPPVTRVECSASEIAWAKHLRERNGVEEDWPAKDTKANCRALFPTTFAPALWVSFEYCESNEGRLAQAREEIDKTTNRSNRLEHARKTLPELSGLDDWHAIDLMQRLYYKGTTKSALAAAVFLDAPPDALAVADACKQIRSAASAK